MPVCHPTSSAARFDVSNGRMFPFLSTDDAFADDETWDQGKLDLPAEIPLITQERAYTSPIWYAPAGE